GETGFELAKLVRSADENGIHGVDAAAHFIGRAQLDEHLANHDADHVAGSYEKERTQRDEEISGNSEKDGGQAESCDAPQHSGTCLATQRLVREQHGHNARAEDRKSTRLNSSHVAISYAV